MMKTVIARAAILVLAAIAAGCTSSSDTLSSASSSTPQIDPNSTMRDGLQTVRYTADDGQVFGILFRYDPLLRGYGVDFTREGTPLSDDSTDDALVQNTIREYFGRNICSAGYYPGLLGGDFYGSRGDGRWVAKVKCTTKQQAPMQG
ncbi:MAG: hypothetical protein KDJ66_01910 [Nitratireductor sp.]|nr:hypothetical protein [Nitratireductor sp.]